MVPLPLFKLAALLVRHVSKYGANQIKAQAREHPRFRQLAARYGQAIHQFNMRANVALLRNQKAEEKAKEKEKAEAPTVKTKEEIEKEEERKAKEARKEAEMHREKGRESRGDGASIFMRRPGHFKVFSAQNVWRRKFRPLPEAKAVDLFADVVGDAFILGVAGGLIIYEYWKSTQKPDHNLERIKDLDARLEELKKREDELERREEELETAEREARGRLSVVEEALRTLKDPKTKGPLLPPAPQESLSTSIPTPSTT
ncbi:hypothetical protein SODALDRAFT_332189 [Sodiomyces alkalinus F11]|uniref:OPA3-domain-containing protein n=1 Tax=Sodiomyces alkalinus (strain CBS 110278 / VKM F-3762 / F11) TaxID=1314773 RepID=A0A3N2PZS8_SODAK|nr:hypothetical protein SODALDRAFT_332189 [Sodiomyces alkalinus F11]ROT40031.1 hypothetical protein SODALDRAFT_332189 [Sodiomyces alkalinus F11]